MATLSDIASVIESALTEIGVTGSVLLPNEEGRHLVRLGQPSEDDLYVLVTVAPLKRG